MLSINKFLYLTESTFWWTMWLCVPAYDFCTTSLLLDDSIKDIKFSSWVNEVGTSEKKMGSYTVSDKDDNCGEIIHNPTKNALGNSVFLRTSCLPLVYWSIYHKIQQSKW